MKNLVIVLVALCVFASATSVLKTPSFLQIKQDPYGFSVASLIEMNLKTAQNTGALDAIAAVLNTLQDALNQQIASTESSITSQRSWCTDHKAALAENLASAQADFAAYGEEQATLVSQQEDIQGNLDSENNDLQVNQESQSKTIIAIADENTRNDAAVTDYSDSIAACQEALQLLSTLQVTPASFIQAKSRFGNVVTLLSKRLQNKSSPLVQPILSVLTELATSSKEVNQDKLGKIIDLIKELLGELSNQQAANQQRHDATIAQLSETVANLDTLIANSQTSVANYTAQLEQIALRLDQVNGLLAQLDSLIQTLQAETEGVDSDCDAYEATYIEDSTSEQQQLALLGQVKDYFLNHIVPSVQNVDDTTYQDDLTVSVN